MSFRTFSEKTKAHDDQIWRDQIINKTTKKEVFIKDRKTGKTIAGPFSSIENAEKYKKGRKDRVPDTAIIESVEIDEAKMSPSVFAQFAKSDVAKNVKVGLEFELYIPDVIGNSGSRNLNETIPNDASLQELFDLFDLSDREKDRVSDIYNDYEMQLQDSYVYNKIDDAIMDEVKNDHLKEIVAFMRNEDEESSEDDDVTLFRKFRNRVMSYATIDEDVFNDEMDSIFGHVSQHHKYYDNWYDYYRETASDSLRDEFYSEGDASLKDFARQEYGARSWRQLADSLDIEYYGGGEEGYDTEAAEELANELSRAVGYDVEAYDEYHASNDYSVWRIEPDSSVTGDGDSPEDMGMEIITSPIPLEELPEVLKNMMDWLEKKNAYTNKNTGLHVNMSFGEEGEEVVPDYLKLVLFSGSSKVLEDFGRQFNYFASDNLKDLKDQISQKSPDDPQIKKAFDTLKAGSITLASKAFRTRNESKYFAINVKGNYVEFRSPGGDYLGAGLEKIMETVYRFAYAYSIAVDPNAFKEEYYKKLVKLLGGTKTSYSDIVDPFVKYVSGMINKNQLTSLVRQHHQYRITGEIDLSQLSVDMVLKILKQNGINKIKVHPIINGQLVEDLVEADVEEILNIRLMQTTPIPGSDQKKYRYRIQVRLPQEAITEFDTSRGAIDLPYVYFNGKTIEFENLTDKI